MASKIGPKVGEYGEQINFKYFDSKAVWSQEDYAEFMEIMDGINPKDCIVYACKGWTHQGFKEYMLQGRKVK